MKESFPGNKEAKESELSQELIRRFDEDQAMRSSLTWDQEVDKKNTARMKEIVAASGWPTISRVGDKAATAAWLLVQHADHDPVFQEECLTLMKSLPDGEVQKQHIAFLEDRVRVNTGRPTLYGTQFYDDPQGVFGPRPIENPETLEERRAAVGLNSFEEYEREIRKVDNKRREQMRASEKK